MTETTVQHPNDAFAERLDGFSAEFIAIARERAALDAREARLLARSAAYVDATAEALVPQERKSSERLAVARRSLCATLAMAVRMSEHTVQQLTGNAEALVHRAPAVLDALAAGRISAQHARVITDQLADVPESGRGHFLAAVLPVAERSTPARLKQRARILRERLHPESITVRAARSEADRRVELEPAADGMAWLHLFTTAPIVYSVMERLDAAVAEARAVPGEDRTCAQLHADALAWLATCGVTPAETDARGSVTDGASVAGGASTSVGAAAAVGESATVGGSVTNDGSVTGGGASSTPAGAADDAVADDVPDPTRALPRPVAVEAHIRATVQVTVPALTMLDQSDTPGVLDGYGPIDPDTASRLALTAPSMTRVLTHPETGAILSVGREQYRVPADLQRAVRLRDGTCRAPGCGRRARACDLDHSVAWEDGGTTAVGNLACLCRHHHRLKHLPGWSLDHQPDGVLTWTTPDRRTHYTEPEPAPF